MIAEHKGEIPFAVLLFPFLTGIGLGIFFSVIPFILFVEMAFYSLVFAFISPNTNINFINKYYDYGLLIIDNSNSNKLIADLENQAKFMHVNYKILQRNKSLIFTSN